MLAFDVASIYSALIQLLQTYVEPYVVLILILAAFVWVSTRIVTGRRLSAAKDAMGVEIKLNIELSKKIVEYAEGQKVGSPYSLPIPRFYTTAFDNLRSQGYLYRMKKGLADELVTIYMTIERIHAACDRQEDLAVGPAATSPLAADLRSENLSFIASSVNNTVKPRLEYLLTKYGKR